MAFGKDATHLRNGHPQRRPHCRANWGLKTESGLAEDTFPKYGWGAGHIHGAAEQGGVSPAIRSPSHQSLCQPASIPAPPQPPGHPTMGTAELEGVDAGEGQFLGPTMKAQQAKTLRTGPRSSP